MEEMAQTLAEQIKNEMKVAQDNEAEAKRLLSLQD